jgi:hypothetical protein
MQKSANKYYSLITAIAFFVNVMLPSYAVYNLPEKSATAKEMSSLFGDKVLICTSDGFKWFSWEDIQSGKAQPKTHSQIKCPVCYVAVHSLKHTLPQQNVELAYNAVIQTFKFHILQSDVFTKQLFLKGRLSRAPPSYIMV